MKQFFKFMFASMVGTILSGVVLMLIFIAIVSGMIVASMDDLQSKKEQVSVKENSVLVVDLDRAIGDRSSGDDVDFNFGPFNQASILGVDEIRESLEKAAKDDRIKGIYLQSTLPMAGYANLLEIRDLLKEFKNSGKWILAYNEVYAQSGYYLATVADELYVFPEGGAEISGFSASVMFFKNALEKLGVEAQIIRGRNNKFKSAVEPFMYDKMSDANRAQLTEFIGDRWQVVRQDMAEGRGLEV
ncbi:MAG: S49 family peptidase, partial [Luteibaculum sp.]